MPTEPPTSHPPDHPPDPNTTSAEAVVDHVRNAHAQLQEQIAKAIVGQREVVDQLLICLFCRGHGLLVGVPGLAKTLLVSTIARTLNLAFNRIQFTPDLMPSDITGTEVIEEDRTSGKRHLRFVHGPVFANMILADEINRTPPKTQAALLEAMQEHHVTTGGFRRPLPQPFFVLATQNPIEQEGTYPLPEAQLDRFMFMIQVGYPTQQEELEIVKRTTTTTTAQVEQVLDEKRVLEIQNLVRQVPIADHVVDYTLRLVRATRPTQDKPDRHTDAIRKYLAWGAGPRASQNLVLAAKARALIHGQTHVRPEDIQAVAHPVLRHRLILNFTAQADGVTQDALIDRLLFAVPLSDANPTTQKQLNAVMK